METKVKQCKCCGKELPVEMFSHSSRNKDGLQSYCKECQKELSRQRSEERKRLLELGKKGGKKLSDYTPRELMEELRSRGYKGTLTYVEVHKIDLENF